MSSLSLYRTLVPDARHAALDDDVVETFLEVAARGLSSIAFGVKYPEAAVWLAAHLIETTPGVLSSGSAGAGEVGPITSQKDGDLARSYGAVAGSASMSVSDADLMRTTYGLKFLQVRGTRSSSAPFGIPIV